MVTLTYKSGKILSQKNSSKFDHKSGKFADLPEDLRFSEKFFELCNILWSPIKNWKAQKSGCFFFKYDLTIF